jgi:hypothetical protein
MIFVRWSPRRVSVVVAVFAFLAAISPTRMDAGQDTSNVPIIVQPSGSNADNELIQNAIDSAAATGGTVHLSAGVYHLTIADGIRALMPRARVQLVGAGPHKTILVLQPPREGYKGVFYPAAGFLQDLSGFALRDLAVDQNTKAQPIASAEALADRPRTILTVFAGSHIVVDNCRFYDVAGTNTLVFNGPTVTDVRVTNSHFETVGNTAPTHFDHSTIYLHADQVRVVANTFSGRNAPAGSYGATTAIETHGNDQIVSGNVVDGYLQGMNVTGIANASDHIMVSNNAVSNALVGVHLWSQYYGSNRTEPALKNVVVTRNTISLDRDAWAEILGINGGLTTAGVLIDPHDDAPIEYLRIDHNDIGFKATSIGLLADDQSGGIEMWLINATVVNRDITIANNLINGSYGPGIRLSMATDGGAIEHNTVRNAGCGVGRFAEPFRAGLLVSHSQRSLVIRQNRFIDDQPVSTMKYGIYDATSADSTGLTADSNNAATSADDVPAFQNAAGGGVFFVSYVTERAPILPDYPVAAGSMIIEVGSARVRTQTATPSGRVWRSTVYGAAPPTTGTWAAGDMVLNVRPVPGRELAWICVVGGTPGTFRTLLQIDK